MLRSAVGQRIDLYCIDSKIIDMLRKRVMPKLEVVRQTYNIYLEVRL